MGLRRILGLGSAPSGPTGGEPPAQQPTANQKEIPIEIFNGATQVSQSNSSKAVKKARRTQAKTVAKELGLSHFTSTGRAARKAIKTLLDTDINVGIVQSKVSELGSKFLAANLEGEFTIDSEGDKIVKISVILDEPTKKDPQPSFISRISQKVLSSKKSHEDLAHQMSRLTLDQRQNYIVELAKFGKVMESENKINRNLDPKNISIEGGGPVLPASEFTQETQKGFQEIKGHPPYNPPISWIAGKYNELEQKVQYSRHQDTYTMGLIFLQIATAGRFDPRILYSSPKDAFPSMERVNTLRDFLKQNFQRNQLALLIISMINPQPSDRIDCQDAVEALGEVSSEDTNLEIDYSELKKLMKGK